MRRFLIVALVVPCMAVPVVEAAEDAVPDEIVLLIGQSNMAGRAALETQDQTPLGGCLLWNGRAWERARPPLNRYSTHQKPGSLQGLSPGPSFVAAYRAARPDLVVGIASWARGGTTLQEWHPEHREPFDLYEEAVRQTHAALKTGGRLAAILWHQGEDDVARWQPGFSSEHATRVDAYPELFRAHVQRLREEFQQPDLPIVFGQLGQWRDDFRAFNEMIVRQPEHLAHTACVSTEGLTNSDPWHFDRRSQIELGRRYAVQLLKLLEE